MSPTANRTPVDVRDDTALAVAFAEIDARQTLMEKSVTDKMSALTSAVEALSAEVRHVTRQVGEVAVLQHQQSTQNSEIGRLATSIGTLAGEFSSWKQQHETKNDVTATEVAEYRGGMRLTRLLVGIVGSVLMLTIAAVGFWVNRELYWIDKTFEAGKTARADLETRLRAAHDVDVARLQAQLAELRADRGQADTDRGAR